MKSLEKLENEIASWSDVSVYSHRFSAREFRFGAAEIGHIHSGGTVDIPFPRSIRDELLAEGLAEEHRWVPNSGWITFQIRSEKDFDQALWLMRLSYLRYALKSASDSHHLFEQESEQLRLSPRFKSLLEPFVPRSRQQVPVDPLSA
jgi:Luciferase